MLRTGVARHESGSVEGAQVRVSFSESS
jgi:hypothetical protein